MERKRIFVKSVRFDLESALGLSVNEFLFRLVDFANEHFDEYKLSNVRVSQVSDIGFLQFDQYRDETDEEMAARKQQYAGKRDWIEQRERLLLKQLKEKYEV